MLPRRRLALLSLLLVGGGCRNREAEKAARPNVLLITLDTTRADRLGCYGYARPTSPNLDRLAAESMLHTRALATSSWTLPSHASLFTGKLTLSHGAQYDPEGPLNLGAVISGPSEWRQYRARPLLEAERTLAEILRDAGYTTAAVVAGPWLKRPFGLAQGFDYYDDDQIEASDGRRAGSVTAAALRFFERRKLDAPFFLFLNYYDPHGPYDAPEPFGHAFLDKAMVLSDGIPKGEELQARYDAEILYMDDAIGQLLSRLRETGLFESTLMVVTSDHGELLGEHGRLGHGETLTEQELRIPLLVKRPGRESLRGKSPAPAQLTDVLPTVLSELGLPLPAGIQGGALPKPGHPVVAEVYPLPWMSRRGQWRALYDGPLKFLWNSAGEHQLFDLAADPGESRNLASRELDRLRRMSALLERYMDSLPRPGQAGRPKELDDETRRALRSLGYLH